MVVADGLFLNLIHTRGISFAERGFRQEEQL